MFSAIAGALGISAGNKVVLKGGKEVGDSSVGFVMPVDTSCKDLIHSCQSGCLPSTVWCTAAKQS